jgi:Ca2+-binding EF-hand superfamily protein
LEIIFNKANRIRHYLKSKFKTRESLHSTLESISQNNRISLDSLQTFIKENTDSKEPKEIDSLLSSYDYNKDNQTDISEVVNFIFMDNNSAQDHLHLKRRAIPPLRSVSQSPGESRNSLKTLLLQIEQKMFTEGTNRFLPVFKSFDRDNDGFLTFEDLESGLKANQITHSSSDAKDLFNFLDENSNGFVSFHEFCRKIQPNIITVNRKYLKEEELAHINLAQPSRVFYETQRARLPPLISQSNESPLKVATRYGYSPPFKDTFPAFAPGKESPMFLDEEARYYPKRFEPINFGHEDKAKIRKSLDSKIEVIKKVRENRDFMIQMVDSKVSKTDEMNVLVKQSMKMGYEKRVKE